MITFNKYLGWLLLSLSGITFLGFTLCFQYLGPYGLYILAFILMSTLPFAITGFLGTRDPEKSVKSRDNGIHIGRIYVVVTTIVVPVIADHDFLYISLIGALVILASYYYRTYKELQLLIINSIGILVVGIFGASGVAGLIDSL